MTTATTQTRDRPQCPIPEATTATGEGPQSQRHRLVVRGQRNYRDRFQVHHFGGSRFLCGPGAVRHRRTGSCASAPVDRTCPADYSPAAFFRQSRQSVVRPRRPSDGSSRKRLTRVATLGPRPEGLMSHPTISVTLRTPFSSTFSATKFSAGNTAGTVGQGKGSVTLDVRLGGSAWRLERIASVTFWLYLQYVRKVWRRWAGQRRNGTRCVGRFCGTLLTDSAARFLEPINTDQR